MGQKNMLRCTYNVHNDFTYNRSFLLGKDSVKNGCFSCTSSCFYNDFYSKYIPSVAESFMEGVKEDGMLLVSDA